MSDGQRDRVLTEARRQPGLGAWLDSTALDPAALAHVRDLLAGEEMREAVAEALSCDEALGEFTRYSEDAVNDHNRWSWRGDGHGEAMREPYRVAAAGVLAVVAERLGGAR